MSSRKIAQKLNTMPSAAREKGWSNVAVSRILDNEIYAGTTYYGRTRSRMKGSKRVITNLPKEEWIPIEVPELAVIDKATFERAQERKIRNKGLAKRNKKRNYLMSGHFRCGTCEQIMTGYHLQGYLYYQCKTKHPKPNQKPCATANKSIIAHRVDDLVWDWICVLLTDDAALDDGLNKMIENNRDETGTKRNRLETIKNLIEKRKNSTERLVGELAEGEYSDEFTRGIFQQKINENTEVIRELEKERDRFEAELAQVELTEDFDREIKALAAQAKDKFIDASFAGKRAIMDKSDLKAVFRHDGETRWLDLSCNLCPDELRYNLQEI